MPEAEVLEPEVDWVDEPLDWASIGPTLLIVPEWVRQHCTIPDGFAKGDPFVMSDAQLWCTLQHYRVKPVAKWKPSNPAKATAFVHRRSQVVAPQKWGKGPWSATVIANEAVGPALFAGWAKGGEVYECRKHGCGCGWSYAYEPGEPMGMPWPTPLIQLTGASEDQVWANVFEPLQEMIKAGPLADFMRVTEGFIAVAGGGEIAPVTSSANSRLGQRVTFVLNDESGLYTKANKLLRVAQTQGRGAAGMGGRTMETTNCWDPSENSRAQQTFESRRPDIFKFYRQPNPAWDYLDDVERHLIHAYVYNGCNWIDLEAIEGDAAELIETDPGQAERFFGNRLVYGHGQWMPEALWLKAIAGGRQRSVAA